MKKKHSLEQSTKQLEFAVVSDCHLPVDSDSIAFSDFLEFLQQLTHYTDHIVLSGDMFQVWAGNTLLDHENGNRLLETIQMLSDRSSFYFLEGNWDFYICRNYSSYFSDCSETVLELNTGDRSVVIVHGHLWTTYRDWLLIFLLKNPLSYRLFGTGLFNSLLNKLNHAFQKKLYSKKVPEKILSDIADRLKKKYHSADIVLCGHFHQAFVFKNVVFMPDYGKDSHFTGFNGEMKTYTLENGNLVDIQ